MNSLFIIILFSLFLSFSTNAGDEVNNGGGISESNIVVAYENLDRYINVCLSSPSCNLLQRERSLLKSILNSLDQEYKNKNQLKFLSEKENPGTFIINGEMKIAKTGSEIGSPLYFNSDLLYLKNHIGVYEGIHYSQAVSLLVHELGHHHPIYESTEMNLYTLGNKVSQLLQRHSSVSKLSPYSDDIHVMVFNEKSKRSFPQIIIYAYGNLLDVSEEFKKNIACPLLTIPSPFETVPDLNISYNRQPLGATFHNTSWVLTSKFYKGYVAGRYTLKGNLSNYCKKESTFLTNNKKYSAQITFSIEATLDKSNKKVYRFKQGSLKIKQYYNPWWKNLKLPTIF